MIGMDFSDLIQFIRKKYNIDLLKYKESRIKKRTALFMTRKNIADYHGLILYLDTKERFNEFMQFHWINVSYFLRDRQLFDNLVNYIVHNASYNQLLNLSGVLSMGCSKGEELYSFAFLLIDRGLRLPQRMVGIDSDESLIGSAKSGYWHKNSVQNYDTLLKNHLIRNADDCNGYKIKYAMDKNPEFFKFDIMTDNFESLLPEYALIMCRNFIIYLNEEFREHFLSNISRLIIKNGLLFLGSSEVIHNPKAISLEYLDHCLYRKIQ